MHSFSGVDMPRLGDGYPFGIYPCADGHLGVNILTQGHWTGLCRLMGRDDLVDHPRYRTGVERADPEVAAELDAIITEWAATQPAERDVPRRPGDALRRSRSCRRRRAVLASAQYAARDYWVDDDDRAAPSTPFRLASGAFAPFRPASGPAPTPTACWRRSSAGRNVSADAAAPPLTASGSSTSRPGRPARWSR